MLKGTRLAHLTRGGKRQKLLKEKAWVANGAEIVSDLGQASHVVVGVWSEPVDAGETPVVRESWPSDCIEVGELLDVEGYRVGKRPRGGDGEGDGAGEGEGAGEGAGAGAPKAARKSAFSFKTMRESPYNQEITDFFHELANQRAAAGKEFSARAYTRAIAAVEEIPMRITSVAEAEKLLPSVFKGRIRQSLEALLNGTIPAAALAAMREKSQTLARFQAAIYGVGAKRALEFYNMGCRTLEDVRAKTTDAGMLASIEHSNELLQRISRTEVERHHELLRRVLHELDPGAETMCMGSYRREKRDCGDIDIIITKRGASRRSVQELTRATVAKLFERGIATYTFGGDGSHRWLGATHDPEVGAWRRMDLLSVEYKELGAAMCYYTGSDIFNRCMRYRAQQIGMQLNETGLFKGGVLLESASERRIFELLGIEWREPRDRVHELFALAHGEST